MKTSRAFTLLEILAATLLFSLGVTGIIAVVIHGLNGAAKAQSAASAWMTAAAVVDDPLPFGVVGDRSTGSMQAWTWSNSGSTWTANDGSSVSPWTATLWDVDQAGSVVVADMAAPIASNPAVFPSAGAPLPGCARGWLNGYYVERREQSLASERIGAGVRLVSVRVDVYWAERGGDGRPLASLVDRIVRRKR